MRLLFILAVLFLLMNSAEVSAQHSSGQGAEGQGQDQPGEVTEGVENSAEGQPGSPEAAGKTGETKDEKAAIESIMEIKRLDTPDELYSFELRDADIVDLFRFLAHDYKLNLLVDKDVSGKVTASFNKITLDEAIAEIAESQNLILDKRKNIIKVMPNLITRIFTLKYIEAKKLLGSSGQSSGASQGGSESQGAGGGGAASGSAGGESASGSGSAGGESGKEGSAGGSGESGAATSTESSGESSGSASGASTIYDLLSDKGKILLGSMPNSIMVIDYQPNIDKIGAYLNEVDKKMERRVFRMKYLKASEVVGEKSAATAGEQGSGSSGGGESSGGSSESSGESSGGQ